jgi:CRISPR system Cascade subunit CasA
VVEDLKKPAFFQPPIQGGLSALKNTSAYPDDLDILVTARNHGTKAGRITNPDFEDWILALITLQTFSGFFGQGNYGIARMNGGFATRPGVQLVSRSSIGRQWARDVRILLDNPDHHRSWELPMRRDGHKLLWLLPWDGKESLPLESLHPWWLEICRLVRLVKTEQGLTARSVGTKTTRISAKSQKGNVGDPWIPILMPDAAAFNRRPTYRVCQSVLFPLDEESKQYRPPLLQKRHDPDKGHDLAVRFRVLICGQGKTEGYEERIIPVPKKAEKFAFGPREPDAARTSRAMVELSSDAQKVLKLALLRFMQAAREQISFQQPETNSWANAYARDLDKRVDQMFFPYLWQGLERMQDNGDEDSLLPWKKYLRDQVKISFEQATRSLPVAHALWPKALAKAEGQLNRGLRKYLHITYNTQGA